MLINVTSTEYVYIPVRGPAGIDLTQLAVDVAIVGAAAGEPGSTDWKAAVWFTAPNGDTEAKVLYTAGDYPVGGYMAYVRVHATPQLPVIEAGRIRIA